MKSKIPLLLVLAGLILIGIGVWQFIDVKVQTKASLNEAKEIVSEQQQADSTQKRHLGELKKGDSLMVKDSTGNNEYEITFMKIVKANDTRVITLQNKQEELILTTCYPFRYVGNAPKRYIIYAKPKS
ncbi:hypothetical protein BIV60_01250 [Bacillus sp. MUM 116]|uniref:sortase n=1 Tax=Bacillus sp. MUM 116 TaxID=1678002 RepID=UPI0008F5E3A4|nr:hypothetical protein BIV60_01250 [Bacillus sp. MUM 116]